MKKVVITLLLLVAGFGFWFGERLYFMHAGPWDEAYFALERSPLLVSEVGPVAEVNIGWMGFSRGTAGWGIWVRLHAEVIGERGRGHYRLYLEKRQGKNWELQEASPK